jgi:hypothetical protein
VLKTLPLVCLLAACTSSPEVETNIEASASENKIICTSEKIIGSHFTKRVCRTAGQIKIEQEATRRLIESQRRLSTGSPES